MTQPRWELDWEDFAVPTSPTKCSSQPNQLRSDVIKLLAIVLQRGKFIMVIMRTNIARGTTDPEIDSET